MSRDALLAAVYAAPDDDEPRRVYADWLLQNGDPRGEFIQLQLTSAKTKEQTARERKLFVVWSDEWLAELGAHPLDAVFERGFVAIARPREKTIRAVPGWATVHTLRGAAPLDAVAMPALRTLSNLDDSAIAALAKLERPLAVRELWWTRDFGDYPNPFPPWATITALPELRRVLLQRRQFRHEQPAVAIEWLWRAPWAQLDELVVSGSVAALPEWLAATAHTSIRRIELRDGTDEVWLDSWRCAVARDADDKLHFEAFAPPYNPELEAGDVRRCIAGLPGLASARVTIPHATRWRPNLDTWFSQHGITPVLDHV